MPRRSSFFSVGQSQRGRCEKMPYDGKLAVEDREAHQHQKHDEVGAGGRHARAENAQSREAGLAKNQAIVERGVDDQRDDAGDQRGENAIERREGPAQGDHAERRQQRPLNAMDVNACAVGERRRLADKGQDRACAPQQRPERQGEQHRGDERLMRDSPHADQVGAVRPAHMRRQRRGDGDNAETEQKDREVEVKADRTRRERLGREPAQHCDVGRHHPRHRQVRDDHRPCQGDARANLRRQAGGGAEKRGCWRWRART